MISDCISPKPPGRSVIFNTLFLFNSPWRTFESVWAGSLLLLGDSTGSLFHAGSPVPHPSSPLCLHLHLSEQSRCARLGIGGRATRSRRAACWGTTGCWQRGPQAMVAILALLLPDTAGYWGETRRTISGRRTDTTRDGEAPPCGHERSVSRHAALVFSSVKYPEVMAHAPCVSLCV